MARHIKRVLDFHYIYNDSNTSIQMFYPVQKSDFTENHYAKLSARPITHTQRVASMPGR